MQMALTEILEMPTVPVKVAMNEYIDMAKYYSTPKSKNFVNGILDSLLIEFKKKEGLKKWVEVSLNNFIFAKNHIKDEEYMDWNFIITTLTSCMIWQKGRC